MKCPYCSAEIEDGAKFCTNCGRQIGEQDPGTLPDEPPKKDMEKLIRVITIATAAIMTVIIGITLGVRSFAARKLAEGQEYYEKGNWDAAIPALKSAYKWGSKEASGVMLADSYYRTERIEEAYQLFEKLDISDNEYATGIYADTCEMMALKSLRSNQQEMALRYLEKEYDLTGDERIRNRIKAIQGGGSYADEAGNVYNLEGLPETLVLLNERGEEVYRTDIVYDYAGYPQYLKAYQKDSPQKTVFGSFEWEDGAEYEMTVYPSADSYSWIAEKSVMEEGELRTLTTLSEVSKQILSFSRTRNTGGALTRETITSSTGETAEIEWPGEENPDHAVMQVAEQTYILALSYDSDGNMTSLKITKNLLQTVMQIDNTYEEGKIVQQVTRITGMPMSAWKPARNYSKTVTEYSGKHPMTRSVFNENGKLIARGYYISGSWGSCWLMMYLPQ